MTKFSDLKLDPKVLQAVLEAGYETPTPIQMGAIPPALEGRDVLGIAQTGTGKTAGFVLPMITLLGRGRARARMPRSLVLCPTRELAAQVAENFDTYSKHTRLTKALLIGGVSFGEQDKLIDRGVDVLIATPGRLLDHVERGKLLLTGVQIMVVDEADRMLDMGFIPDIERIFQLTPFTRQTLFFSATMAPEIERITNTFLHSPERVEVARQASASETITQRLVQMAPARRDVAARQKRDLLRALIDAEGELLTNAIIFCNRKTDVDIVSKSLAKYGYDAAPIHGDLDQSQRTRTLESFRDGKLRLLVASDVAARGLDIPAVSHVFNFDLPSHAEDYVHRIGRTGRAGRLGTSISIGMPSDEKYLTAIEQLLKQSLPRVEMPEGFVASDAPSDEDRPREGRKGADTKSEDRKGGSRDRSRRRRDAEPQAQTPVEQPVETRVEQHQPAAQPVAQAAPEALPEARPDSRAETRTDSRPEPRRDEPRRSEPRRDEARAEQPARDETRREEPRRDDRRDDRRGERRDGRRGRDQEGRSGEGRGHQVMGLGDHVPQFMLVELRSAGLSEDVAPRPEAAPAAEAEPEAKPARRTRGRGRGKASAETEARTDTPETPIEAPAEAAVPAADPVAPEADPAPKPKRSRSRKTPVTDVPVETVKDAAPAEAAPTEATQPSEATAEVAPEKPKRGRPRKTAAPKADAAETDAPAPKKTRSRRKADAAPEAATTDEAASENATPAAAPKRTRRKKTDPAADDASQSRDADAEA
ncbi:DEAD/DEAH box helicase [Paracoccus gahaiensis]|uniref:DEAD-box ATP-dependent RNA helicase RhpA n=1 Tax=Paracoccus gahaiensis TaxID=1706839 RepID=A0A4V5MVT6_9RHOB|nr:DEAD/DEAH box helicase [Paracoccus gahaiensis]